jgi:hypothetical protein
VADATAWPRRHDSVVMVAYCCSVQRCHLLHCILTWLLYRYDLIYADADAVVAMAVVCCHGRRLLPWPSFVATAVIRSVCAKMFTSAVAKTLLLWPSRRYESQMETDCRDGGRFMAQMTADGRRDGTVDCRACCCYERATRRNTMKTKSNSSVVAVT